MKGLRNLDYAVYGKVIVPMIMFDTETMFQLYDDSDAGKCTIVSKKRKR
ncbi:hypothetical protein [Paenibacillus pinihumi]|nr:hypothetical protein [Paenibacillus pinihumi]